MSVFRKIFVRMGAPASIDQALSTAAVPRAGQEHYAKLVNNFTPQNPFKYYLYNCLQNQWINFHYMIFKILFCRC